MKEAMLNVMNQMFPYMKIIAYVGVAFLVLGALALLLWILLHRCSWLLRLSGRLLILLGLFFLACQVAGYFLGMTPEINFGDISKLEFNTMAFWIIGLVLLVPGFFLRILGAFRALH
jgi:hypothetical protein